MAQHLELAPRSAYLEGAVVAGLHRTGEGRTAAGGVEVGKKAGKKAPHIAAFEGVGAALAVAAVAADTLVLGVVAGEPDMVAAERTRG